MDKQEFLTRSTKIHGNEYDYSKVPEKITIKDKITIICPEHGEFQQIVYNHTKGARCIYCNKERAKKRNRKTNEMFIRDAKQIHGDKYDYSKIEYRTAHDYIIINCPVHGDWQTKPNHHLNGCGCPKCNMERLTERNIQRTHTTDEFIEKSRKVHQNKYDYSKTVYIKDRIDVVITCPVHGDFIQNANSHKQGRGCPKCGSIQKAMNIIKGKSFFVEKSKQWHGDKYDYSMVPDNLKVRDKITIKCPIHGEFQQTAYYHTNGNGCPKCNSSKGELKISAYLEKNDIVYEKEKIFKEFNSLYRFDFYLPEYQTVIEFDGIQHFQPIDFSHGFIEKELIEENFNKLRQRDKEKDEWCELNDINLLRIPYYSIDKVDYLIETELNNCKISNNFLCNLIQ